MRRKADLSEAKRAAACKQAMAIAFQHHQAGRLAEAERIYRRVLRVRPRDSEALHLLGVLALQAGRLDRATSLLRKAIATNGEVADYHNTLGELQRVKGELAAAATCYRRALSLRPNFAEAHSNLGVAQLQTGALASAAASFEAAIALESDYVEAHVNLAATRRQQQRTGEAIECYNRAISIQPDFAAAHYNLANLLKDEGRLAEAVDGYRRALAIEADSAEAYSNLGVALMKLGRLNDAAASIDRALALNPRFSEAYTNRGNVMRALGRYNDAIASLDRALELRSDFAEAHNNMGEVLREQGELHKAMESFRRALAGEIATKFLDPLEQDWARAGIEFNLGFVQLLLGDFEHGLRAYEARRLRPDRRREGFPTPEWDGSDPAGRTIVLHAEQGFGDNIQFIRYALILDRLGARVHFTGRSALDRLFSSMPRLGETLTVEAPASPDLCHAPLPSLPFFLKTRLNSIPADIPYLVAERTRVARWREYLATKPGFRVGIAWQGNPSGEADPGRSIPLAHFAPLARLPGVRLIGLQVEHGRDQIGVCASDVPLEDLGALLTREVPDAFVDTAAAMMSLDLVVTSDTAVAHLAGALGRPVWVVLRFIPDWRWLLGRDDSPWYPTMRLFRQPASGDWTSAFVRVEAALRARLESEVATPKA